MKIQSDLIKIRLIKSVIGVRQEHKMIVKALGLKKINSERELIDNFATRGMINKVSYLLKII